MMKTQEDSSRHSWMAKLTAARLHVIAFVTGTTVTGALASGIIVVLPAAHFLDPRVGPHDWSAESFFNVMLELYAPVIAFVLVGLAGGIFGRRAGLRAASREDFGSSTFREGISGAWPHAVLGYLIGAIAAFWLVPIFTCPASPIDASIGFTAAPSIAAGCLGAVAGGYVAYSVPYCRRQPTYESRLFVVLFPGLFLIFCVVGPGVFELLVPAIFGFSSLALLWEMRLPRWESDGNEAEA